MFTWIQNHARYVRFRPVGVGGDHDFSLTYEWLRPAQTPNRIALLVSVTMCHGSRLVQMYEAKAGIQRSDTGR
jgi:hypothetical protein